MIIRFLKEGLSNLASMEIQNSDLYKLAKDVLKEYNIEPYGINIIQSASIKTVWKLKTKSKDLCLKRLKQSYDKALFSVNAQEYISSLGGNVPGIIRDKNNNLIVNFNDQLFVVYQWLDGRDLEFGNTNSLKEAVKGLSKFHTFSKGYKAPADAKVSSKLGKWPEQYESMKNKLLSWKDIAGENPQTFYNTYLKHVDDMVKIADSTLELLNTSSYNELTSSDSQSVVLCHQDYGKGNAILTDNGVYVIDLDGVTYEHPARDLRKIIGKLAENRGVWDLSTISNIVDWYSEANHLSEADKELVYIDMLYPHWFYGLVKNIFKNNKAENSSKIEKIAKLEMSKIPLLKSLIKKR